MAGGLKTGRRRRRPPSFFAALALLAAAPGVAAEPWRPVFMSQLALLSEPVPVAAALDSWESPFFGGRQIWGQSYLEAGVDNSVWMISAVYRRDVTLRFSEDTAEFYYQVRNDLKLAPSRQYALELRGYHYELGGVRVARHLALGTGGKATVGLTVFAAQGLQELHLEGTAGVAERGEYAYEGQVDYRYGRDYLFYRPVNQPTGRGATLDMSLQWRSPGAYAARLTLRDLMGRIHWQQAPLTDANVHSARRGLNSAGWVQVEPILAGIESSQDFTQPLEPYGELALWRHVWRGFGVDTEMRCRKQDCLYGLGASLRGLRVLYWPEHHRVGLSLDWGQFSLELTTDSLDLDKAHGVTLDFAWGRWRR